MSERPAQAGAAAAPIAIWLVGLSGAGKSVTAQAIAAELARDSRPALVLDGDELREGLNADLGFSRADRHEAARRTAAVSVQAAASGVVPVTAMITPYASSRAQARAVHEAAGVAFVEVWVATPIEVCAARDGKGLYAAARRGQMTGMTGVDDPFEEPANPDCVVDASSTPALELARRVLAALSDIAGVASRHRGASVKGDRSRNRGRLRPPERRHAMDVSRSDALGGTHELAAGLKVHRLGFGAMRVTGQGVWGPPADHDAAIAVLRRAVELGVDLIDTADSYGPAVSEELIAEALHPYPSDLVIATKGGLERSGPGQWSRNGRPEHLRAACEGSLRRLRVDCIDLYQLHAPDADVPYEDSVGTLAQLRDEGKIRHVGVSNVSVEQLEQARAIVDVVTVQNRFNLTDRSSASVLEVCERDGLGFFPWFPLAAGELAGPGGVVADIAERHDATPGQVALAWLLAHSPVLLPIPGTGSVGHLEENVAAGALALPDDDLARLDAAA